MDRFTAKVRDTKNLQKDIKERINEIKDGLGTQLEERIKLENNLEEFPRWVQSKESEVACPSLLPLKSEATDKIRHKYLKIDEELRSFCNVNITGIRRRAEHLMKDCDEEEADELDEEVNGIIASVSDLSQTLNETIANVTKSIKLKNSFELQVDTATKWISKAESSSQVDPKNLQSNVHLIQIKGLFDSPYSNIFCHFSYISNTNKFFNLKSLSPHRNVISF